MNARRCSARSKQSGKRCRRSPIPGGTVCVMHGGKAPQVARSARERIAALVDPALDALGRLVRDRKHKTVALGAARDVLDRAGLAPPSRVELSGGLRLDGLRVRLSQMGEGRVARLAELLQREPLDDGEAAELRTLRREAGLAEEAG